MRRHPLLHLKRHPRRYLPYLLLNLEVLEDQHHLLLLENQHLLLHLGLLVRRHPLLHLGLLVSPVRRHPLLHLKRHQNHPHRSLPYLLLNLEDLDLPHHLLLLDHQRLLLRLVSPVRRHHLLHLKRHQNHPHRVLPYLLLNLEVLVSPVRRHPLLHLKRHQNHPHRVLPYLLLNLEVLVSPVRRHPLLHLKRHQNHPHRVLPYLLLNLEVLENLYLLLNLDHQRLLLRLVSPVRRHPLLHLKRHQNHPRRVLPTGCSRISF